MTRIARQIDASVTSPPEGVRLQLGSVMAALGVSFQQLAAASGMSRSAAFNVATANRWPAGYDVADLRQRIEALLRERGASELQLAVLWHAHTRRQALHAAAPAVAAAVSQRPPSTRSTHPTNEEDAVLLAKQTLSAEARRQFALFSNPFDGEVTRAEEMYVNGEVRFVREAIWQAATAGRFVAVVGESGSGKTTLLADAKERIATDRKPVIVIEPSVVGMAETDTRGKVLRAGDILTAIVMTLAPGAGVAQTSERRARQAEQLLAASTTAGNGHLLLIEEAHALPRSTLKHLKRLHERMRLHGRRPMLGILMLAQPELLHTLSDTQHDVREVVQRVEIVTLQPLDHDLQGYLQFRAQQAGRELGALMDAGAVDAIRTRLTALRQGVRNAAVSMVYPLAVNNLVTASLNAAAALGVPLVTADVVREA